MTKRCIAQTLVCTFLVGMIILFTWCKIIIAVILFSVILGFYLCLVADEAFTDRLKEENETTVYPHDYE